VVLPEGTDRELILDVHRSAAHGVMYLLAPPGLMGWSFRDEWQRMPNPMYVPLHAVGSPETYRAIAHLGFTMWTNSYGLAAAGKRAGVAVECLGVGTPVPIPQTKDKTFDLAWIPGNRWGAWAERVVKRLPEASALRIDPIDSVYWLSEALAPARILVFPSRIEGTSRIAREARMVGTIPAMLNTNPFVTPDDYGKGVLLSPDLRAMTDQVRRLLARPRRLAKLGKEAVVSSRDQTDWTRFVGRVASAMAGAAG
jgi:glycosyltransferase involved in cell wall biosynthesis